MSEKKNPKVNPILKARDRAADGESLAKIKGFIAEGPAGFVRVYPSLVGASYMDIPADDVLHFIDGAEEDEPTVLFVNGDADVSVMRVRSGSVKARRLAASRREQTSGGCGGGGDGGGENPNFVALRVLNRLMQAAGGGLFDIGPSTPSECFGGCAYDFRECLRDGKSSEYCNNEADLCDLRCEAIFYP
ncbi:MAG: hypothetical protein ACK2UP_07665 [Candidatus Promineifilaceae bacterium]